MRTTGILLLLAWGLSAQEDGHTREHFATGEEARKEAMACFFRYLHEFDPRGTGKVSLTLLQEQLTGINHSELKSLKLYAGWDLDRDGFVSTEEARAGVSRALDSMVAEKMALDGDGNGSLSPTEYLLGVPPREREGRPTDIGVDANGWNQRQRNIVRSQDRNQDGVISREEISLSQASRAANGYLNLLMLKRARGCDRNGDGKFDLQEFAAMNGIPAGVAIPDAIRSAYSLRGRPRETATYMEFLVLLDHAPSVNKQDLVDKMLRFCATQSPWDKAPPTPEQAAVPLIQLLERLAARHGGRTPLTEFLQVPGMQLGEGRGANRFRSLDADRDGFVTKLELETLVKSEIAMQVEKMSALDADGDGALSKAEYALSLPTHQNRGESANRPPAAKGDFAGSRFDGYDLNRDGKISREEISQFVIANALSRNWANATIPRLTVVDTNKDSYIDKSEFAVFGVGVLLVMADNTGGPGGTPRIKTEHPEKVPIERMTRNLLHLDAAARQALDHKLDEREKRQGSEQ